MSYVFQQIVPPGARGAFKKSLMTDPMWYAEEKLDGDRRIAQFCAEATRFTGRVISKVDGLMVEKTANVPHLNLAVPSLVGTVLDGEMIMPWPGARSRDVTSVMGSQPAEALRKQKERGWTRYRVFDCLFYKGVDIRKKPQADRRLIAYNVVQAWGEAIMEHARAFVDTYDSAHAEMANGAFENIQAFLDSVWGVHGEGIILKRLDGVYGDEKAWVKVKQEETHDVVITGFDPPKDVSTKVTGETSVTKYAAEGLIGAIRFGQYREVLHGKVQPLGPLDTLAAPIHTFVRDGKEYELVQCGATSGFDDKLRRAISKDPKSFVGGVMEITCQLREESGRFRHPRFGQLRDNKTADMCLWGLT